MLIAETIRLALFIALAILEFGTYLATLMTIVYDNAPIVPQSVTTETKVPLG